MHGCPFVAPTTTPLELIPFAFASGSLLMFSAWTVPFKFTTKLVSTVAFALVLKPTIAPELLSPLTVVPPPAACP